MSKQSQRICCLILQICLGIESVIYAGTSPDGEKRALPHGILAQHAGYAGYAALGLGYEWQERWALSVLYGYTPAHLAGRDISSWALKSQVYIGPWRLSDDLSLQPYVGIGVFYNPDSKLFIRLPSKYPRGYYPPTALRPYLAGGMELRIGENWAVGVEFVVLDSELAYWRDSGHVSVNEMGSSGVTVRRLLF